jgi:hypothetical protein
MIPRERGQQIVDETLEGLKAQGVEPDAEFVEFGKKFVEGEIEPEEMMIWVAASLRNAMQGSTENLPIPRDLH